MTFALTWCANIFVGCSVTPTFFRQITSFSDSFHYTKKQKNLYVGSFNCGRQKEPAILISTLLLQTHAPQLHSLVQTRFCWNLESSTTNAWNAKNAIFSRASRVTFGPWITWRSCIAAAPTNPNRSCQLGFDFSVHVVALYGITRLYSVLIRSGNCSSLTSIAERQNCLPLSWQAQSVRTRS